MTMNYTLVAELANEVVPPEEGILSKPIFNDDRLKAVVFGFSKGSELTEHTASMPAVVQFIQGEAKFTLGSDEVQAKPGTWIYMAANLPHSVLAETPTIMLVMLMK